MKVSKLLKTVHNIAKVNRLSAPYVVGGIPRDITMGNRNDVQDIDITTGDVDSLELGRKCHEKWPETSFRESNDGHASIDFKNVKEFL